jgi:hypothetical protein
MELRQLILMLLFAHNREIQFCQPALELRDKQKQLVHIGVLPQVF